MNELQRLWRALLKGTAIIAYSFLYALGGRKQKLWRRLASPFVFIAFMLFLTPISWKALSLLALIPYLWLGYGGGEKETRVKYAILAGISGAFICAVYGNYWMAVLQFFITVGATIFLGLINPIPAVDEEFLIALLSVSVVAFTI